MIKKYFPISIIIALAMILIVVNYHPGTWLTGWDDVHPEFNFGLNIFRGIFSVWQEYQGLGLIGGLAYAADLPRAIGLSIASLFLPEMILRYLSIMSKLVVGPTGMYLLLTKVILAHKSAHLQSMASFVGSLFYLL